MNFIKNILVGFFTFIGTVIGSVAKLLGIAKSEYFLELTEETPSSSAAPPISASSNGAAAGTSGAPASTSQVSAASGSLAALPTPTAPDPKPTPDIVASNSNSAQSIQSPAQPRTAQPAASTVVVPSGAGGNDDKSEPEEPVEPFAPNYLLNRSSTGGRRRPGPSLNMFKEMAKDVGGAS